MADNVGDILQNLFDVIKGRRMSDPKKIIGCGTVCGGQRTGWAKGGRGGCGDRNSWRYW